MWVLLPSTTARRHLCWIVRREWVHENVFLPSLFQLNEIQHTESSQDAAASHELVNVDVSTARVLERDNPK